VIFAGSTVSLSAENTGEWLSAILPAGISPSTLQMIHFAVRKAAHLLEYAILGVLLFRAIRGDRTGWTWRWALSAVVIATLYAVTDEWHQSFVPTRTPSGWDVLIDTSGATLAQVLFFRP
jgi:VanZ family protein